MKKESLLPLPSIGEMSAATLTEQVNSIPMNKSNAVRIIALHKVMEDLVSNAKSYLLTRCADTGSYIDPDTGLTLVVSDAERKSVTSPKIKTLEAEIKKLKSLISEGVEKGTVEVTCFQQWRLSK